MSVRAGKPWGRQVGAVFGLKDVKRPANFSARLASSSLSRILAFNFMMASCGSGGQKPRKTIANPVPGKLPRRQSHSSCRKCTCKKLNELNGGTHGHPRTSMSVQYGNMWLSLFEGDPRCCGHSTHPVDLCSHHDSVNLR